MKFFEAQSVERRIREANLIGDARRGGPCRHHAASAHHHQPAGNLAHGSSGSRTEDAEPDRGRHRGRASP